MTTKPGEHDEQVREYFDARVADYDAFYEQPSRVGRWFNQVFRKGVYARRDQVLTLTGKYDCNTVLDVGCGSGRNTVWWAQNGVESLLGIDVAVEMIDLAENVACRLGLQDRCRFKTADFMESKFYGKYDLVAACGVFDYVRDAVPFLKRMSEHAGKVIYASFPGWTLVRSPLRKIRYTLRGCPTHFYRRAELKRLFEAVGFGTTEILSVGGGYLGWSVRS